MFVLWINVRATLVFVIIVMTTFLPIIQSINNILSKTISSSSSIHRPILLIPPFNNHYYYNYLKPTNKIFCNNWQCLRPLFFASSLARNNNDYERRRKNNNNNDDYTKNNLRESNLLFTKRTTTSRLLPIYTTLDPTATYSKVESEKTVPVQRSYETFRWKYKSGLETRENNENDDNDNHDDETGGQYYYYNINYRVEGPVNGLPILLVHGFGANVNHFRYQFPALTEAGYRVYAVDLIGFGASDKPISKPGSKLESNEPFGYSIELFVTLLEDFIEYIDPVNLWHIAGNSIGGLCCLKIASDNPNRIRSVTLFNCASGMTAFRYEELPCWVRPIVYIFQKIILGPYCGVWFYTNFFKTRNNVQRILITQGVYYNITNVDNELLEILLCPADDNGAEYVFIQIFTGPVGPTPESLLPQIQCPILGIWGEADPWLPVDHGLHPPNTFKQYNTNFTLHVLPHTGHCPHDENPDGCHNIMIPFLQQQQQQI